MHLRTAVLLPLLAACATAPQVVVEEKPGAKWESDRNIAATLRAIRARVKKGDGAAIREELLAQSQNRPGDVKLKLFVAWTGAPSEEAWQEIHKLSKINPDDAWLWTASGLIYVQWKGFLDQADGEFQRALKASKDFLPARVGCADVLRLRGKLDEAKAAYQAALAEAPDWQEALAGLGLTQLELKDPAARATLEKALQLDPDDLAVVTALEKLAVEAKDEALAIELTRKMIAFSPRDREAHLNLARLLEAKGDTAGSAAEYEAAMALGADAAGARALAEAYRKLNKPEEETKALEKVAQLEPKDPAPWLRIADLRKAEGDREGAETALRSASERKPEDAGILLALARQIRERDDLIPAIEAYRNAKAAGSAEAVEELKQAEAKAALGDKPVTGNVQHIYDQVFARLKKQFDERKKSNANLAGRLKVKVSVSPDGKVASVDILEDTVHDDVLAALVYFLLKDATWAQEKRTPTFEFVLAGAK